MTTIAYRNGVMAADTGSRAGDTIHNGYNKLARGPDGSLYGASGNAAEADAYLRWVRQGCGGDSPKAYYDNENSSFIILKATPTGEIRLITARGEETHDGASYLAIGYDSGIAAGALFAGATAEQAIAAAIEHGTGTSGRVQTISHNMTEEIKHEPQPEPDPEERLYGEFGHQRWLATVNVSSYGDTWLPLRRL